MNISLPSRTKYQNGVIWWTVYPGEYIYGEHSMLQPGIDDLEEFFIYKENDLYVLDYVIQGIYVASLKFKDLNAFIREVSSSSSWQQKLKKKNNK